MSTELARAKAAALDLFAVIKKHDERTTTFRIEKNISNETKQWLAEQIAARQTDCSVHGACHQKEGK